MKAVKNNFDDLKVNELLKKHFIELRSVSPAGSTHVLDIDGLKDNTITFWSIWDKEDLIGCGAIKIFSKNHGEFKSIRVHDKFREKGYGKKIIFANGGDRVEVNVPEHDTYDNIVEFVYGVGGVAKKNSSSWILDEWKNPKTIRPWRWYRVLDDRQGYKVKELVIEPGKSLSYQRHFKRAEHWYVLKGKCLLKTRYKNIEDTQIIVENRYYDVGKKVWHQGSNVEDIPCHILEVQHGDECIEEDIERLDSGKNTQLQ